LIIQSLPPRHLLFDFLFFGGCSHLAVGWVYNLLANGLAVFAQLVVSSRSEWRTEAAPVFGASNGRSAEAAKVN